MDQSAGRGRGRGMINGGVQGEMRKPHDAAELERSGEPSSVDTSAEISHMAGNMAQLRVNDSNTPPEAAHSEPKKVTLSVNAPEFVPRMMPVEMQRPPPQQVIGQHQMMMDMAQAQQQHMSQTQQQHMSQTQQQHMPQTQQQHMPQGQQQQHMPPGYCVMPPGQFPPQMEQQFDYSTHPLLIEVDDLVVRLTLQPDRFEQLARQLAEIISFKIQDDMLLREIVAVIFEQGVGEANFRYIGAKLSQYLGQNVQQSPILSPFKNHLLQKCNAEFGMRDYYLQSEPQRLCGFALFMAELLMQLRSPTGMMYDVLRSPLCQLVQLLLQLPTDGNLKCVAQVLKFTGSALEASKDLESVMCHLKDVTMTAPIPQSTRSLLLSVVELRAANWGQGSSPAQSPVGNAPPGPMGTVFYNANGRVSKVEEYEDSTSETEDPGWSPAVEELEGEVADAFEEFLRSQQ